MPGRDAAGTVAVSRGNRKEEHRSADADPPRPHCAIEPPSVPVLGPDLAPDRARAILKNRLKWLNGTVLHYYFFDRRTDGAQVRFDDGTTRFVTWVGPDAQRGAVRRAFQEWKDLGIGLEFREVTDRSESEVRIGFMETDGSWSYVGKDVLGQGVNDRTMNFGWDLTDDYGRTTALHEIGHTLGMPHEHQNPFAGIVWDEAKVYEYFSGPPNNWTRGQAFNNVLSKISVAEVEGSSWDPDSVMEYWFPAGLVREPARYRDGLNPPGGLSDRDEEFLRKWYPAAGPAPVPTLTPFQSAPLMLQADEQADLVVTPPASRTYEVATFGSSDTVLVLFEEVDGELRYVTGDDDSGTERNARISLKLFKGRKYVLRVRLYWAGGSGETAVMYW